MGARGCRVAVATLLVVMSRTSSLSISFPLSLPLTVPAAAVSTLIAFTFTFAIPITFTFALVVTLLIALFGAMMAMIVLQIENKTFFQAAPNANDASLVRILDTSER